MKYLSQFFIILLFTLAGEALQRLLPLPIPASVYGLVLLFAALCLGVVKLGQVKQAGSFLTSLLPLLFVSPAAGVLENWGLVRGSLVPMAALVLASTVLTFGISGRVAQRWMKKEGKGRE
ncbi:MAG: CidA/LrgA family protein [Eubacteriales bacterium]|nr:CidA/LrgA family protein [Eubacteriales bacterium]